MGVSQSAKTAAIVAAALLTFIVAGCGGMSNGDLEQEIYALTKPHNLKDSVYCENAKGTRRGREFNRRCNAFGPNVVFFVHVEGSDWRVVAREAMT